MSSGLIVTMSSCISAATFAAASQKISQALELANTFWCPTVGKRKTSDYVVSIACANLKKPYCIITKSIGKQQSTIVDKALYVLIMMHVIRIEFLADAVQRDRAVNKSKHKY